ncbi:MAG: sulfur reduction protein DsrJ [Gammaproteobacteria bacterium]|nr:sulfur reduction protein DsrJ [Gammaproteobacteria bacterium]MCP5298567.1 sulfur reduction protein DsrJ [Chromatiaceae bacterium]
MKGKFGISVLLALCLVMFVGPGSALADEDDEVAAAGVEGTARADKLDACVAPTAFMRRNHFELIEHQRDITVHEGIRKTDNSLAGCIDCHVRHDAAGQYVPVNAQGEFCSACHEYVGASLDCFTCHATKPTGTE